MVAPHHARGDGGGAFLGRIDSCRGQLDSGGLPGLSGKAECVPGSAAVPCLPCVPLRAATLSALPWSSGD
eukprot:3068944-Alexandrium_andersonii.AAC.1